MLGQERFGLLRPDTRADQPFAAAMRTLLWQPTAAITVVAVQAGRCFVQCHSGIAVGAVTAPAAVVTH